MLHLKLESIIFECKIKGTPASAIKQIQEKNYAQPYFKQW